MLSFFYYLRFLSFVLYGRGNRGKTVGLLAVGVVLSWVTGAVNAEGSRELVANSGYRPYLEYRSGTTAGISRQATIKVFVNIGEQVNLGSSVHNSYNTSSPQQDIVYTSPSGVVGIGRSGSCDVTDSTTDNGNGTNYGFIDTITKETAGPAVGGYTPCVFTAAEDGIYEITFRGPIDPADTSCGSPPKKLGTTEAFPTDNTQCRTVAAWDVTVFKAGVEQKGRVYANYLPLDLGTGNGTMNSKVYFLTDQGNLYLVNLNGIDPAGFIFFANNKGFKDTSGNRLYKSVQLGSGLTLPAGVNLHNPGSPDAGTDITHKMFFNRPDSNLPPTAKTSPTKDTWLLASAGNTSAVSNFKFTGVEGTVNQAGTAGIIAVPAVAGNPPTVGIFSFDAIPAAVGSNYILTIDVNNNGIYGDANDRVFKNTIAATNTIQWNGLDGAGTALSPQTAAFGARISVEMGDVHFPFLDVEKNVNGLIVQQLDRATLAPIDSTVYYDNTGLTGEIPPNPLSATGGVNSLGESKCGSSHDQPCGAQIFDDSPGGTDGFGDTRGIDTWAFSVVPLQLNGGINLKRADLSVTKTHLPSNLTTGSKVTYTITVTNGGPSDVTGVGVQDTNLSATAKWTCAPAANCALTSGSGPINTTVNLPKNTTATFTVTDTVTAAPGTTVTNSATITRPNDVTNPLIDTNGNVITSDVKTETTPPDSYTVATNPPPVAGNDNSTTPANTPVVINVLANDSDADGPSATSPIISNPTSANGGTLTRNADGTLTYTPPAGFVGTDTFTYQVCDNGTPSACATATVTITVTPIILPPPPPPPEPTPTNATPELQNDTASTEPNTPVTVAILTNDRDPDGGLDRTSLSISVDPKKGTVTVKTDGTLVYTPNPDFTTGKDTLIYRVCDLATPPACDTAVVTITLTATPNQAPQATDQALAPVAPDTTTPLPALAATDSDGTIASFTIDSLPAPASGFLYLGDPAKGGVPVTAGQVLTPTQAAQLYFHPQPQFTGTSTFTFTATDNNGAVSPPATVAIPFTATSGGTDNPTGSPSPLTLTISVSGHGEVFGNPNALYCNQTTATCQQVYDPNMHVILTPVSAATWRFEGWVGDCDQNGQVLMTTDKYCQAVFVPIALPSYDLTVSLNGGGGHVVGQILSQPTGIDCGNDCQEDFGEGMIVALTATVEPGFVFQGWSGDCSGTTLTVTVMMTAAKNCVAQFRPANDDDGIPEEAEAAAPNEGDGNSDGIPDNQQNDVASLVTPDGHYVTVATPGHALSDVHFNDQGLLEFAVNSPAAEVTVYYHGIPDLCAKPYRQWLPVDMKDATTATLQDLVITCETQFVNRQPVTTVRFTLTDGGQGDSTPADGVIRHASGWVLPAAQVRFATDTYMIDELGNVSTVTVQRLGSCVGQVSVNYTSQDGTATSDADYVPVSGTLTWADGDCGDKYFTVPMIDDTLLETSETLHLSLVNVIGNAMVATPDKAVVTITDNDSQGCYTTPVSQVCCHSCQSGSTDAGVTTADVRLLIKVGQSAQVLIANNAGLLALQEIPDNHIVELNTWKAIGDGAGEIGVTAKAVGKTRVVVINDRVPAQTTTIHIEVIPNDELLIDDFRIHSVDMTLTAGETRTLTLAGGQGELSIKDIPDMATALLADWIPLGDTGAARLTLQGVRAGDTQMIISDVLGQEVTVTIHVLKGEKGEDSAGTTAVDGATTHSSDTTSNTDTHSVTDSGDGTADTAPTCSLKNAVGIDALGAPLETSTCFVNTLQVAGDPPVAYPNHTEFTAVQAQALQLTATIYIDAADKDQAAEIVLVGVRTTLTDERRYTRDDQTWVEWDDRVSSVPTAQRVDRLPAVVTVPIYSGDLSFAPGEFTVFVGYRLVSGKIIYNGKEPLHFYVGNASSFDLHSQQPQTLTSNAVDATTFFEPWIYNIERKVGNHQTFANTDIVRVTTFVRVDGRHIGQPAAILAVAIHRDDLRQIEYTHTLQGWQVWDNRLESLTPMLRYAELPPRLEIPLTLGELLTQAGEVTIYVGYRLGDNVIVFNGSDPLHLVLVPAISP